MRSRLGLFVLLLLIALPTFAADRVIQSGIDPWRTPGNGTTFVDFSKNPIPAGFFCFKSAPFTGRILLRGVPVATGEPGVLGKTDTIVQRLDDAVFNKNGVARTRVQVRALQLESLQSIQTACGAFKAEVRLNGEQPVTNMRIVRENGNGGRFFAPIAVNAKLVFTPVGRSSNEILEVSRHVRFPANIGHEWASQSGLEKRTRRSGFLLVDTDGDRVPDTYLPGTSPGFAAGISSRPGRGGEGPTTASVADPYCHSDSGYGHMHCIMNEP
jgi:hypothetical protein